MAIPSLPKSLPGLSVRDAIVDGLLRGVGGLDQANKSLFDSAFTDDAVVDVNGAVMTGRDQITYGMYNTISKIDTTHFITNVRVDIDPSGSKASLTASALAQHYRTEEGLQIDVQNLLTGGFYYLELVKDESDGLWKSALFKMRSLWFDGERAIAQGK